MIKDKIISLATAAAMGFCLCGCSESTVESSSEVEFVRPAPGSIVFDWQNAADSKLSSVDAGSSAAFDLIDLDHDSVPEIIISPDTEAATACEIYSIADGQISSIGTIGMNGTFRYLPTMDVLWEEFTGGNFTLGKYVKLNEGVLEPVINYSDNSAAASSGARIVHEINGEDLLLPEYEKQLEPYTSAVSEEMGRKYTFGSTALNYAVHCAESWGAVLTPEEKELISAKLSEFVGTEGAAFELCDLNGDGVPEVIVSLENTCNIYYLSGGQLFALDGSYGDTGVLSFDLEKNVFWSGSVYWSLADSSFTAADFSPSDSVVILGRKYLATQENITKALN